MTLVHCTCLLIEGSSILPSLAAILITEFNSYTMYIRIYNSRLIVCACSQYFDS